MDDASLHAIEALIERDAHEAGLRLAMVGLPPAEREAVELRVIEELDYREITARLN